MLECDGVATLPALPGPVAQLRLACACMRAALMMAQVITIVAKGSVKSKIPGASWLEVVSHTAKVGAGQGAACM
jgi:hypothetical protein